MSSTRLWLSLVALTLTGGLAACSSGGSSTALAPVPSAPPPSVAAVFTSGITASAALDDAVAGPDGRIWFTEFNASKVAAVTTGGAVTEYPVSGQPCGIAVGPDGNLWTGGYGGTIAKITTSGTVTGYPVAGAHVCGIISGPGGVLWFADYGNAKVGAITTGGAVTEYALPPGANPYGGIAVGSDGNVWVPDGGNHTILQISPLGTVLHAYGSGISAGEAPNFIVEASDGNLYFTEDASSTSIQDKVGRITPAGVITEIGTLAPQSYPNEIRIGKDGNAYFTEYSSAKLGKVTIATGTVSESSPGLGPTANSAIAAGPDGRLWIGGFQTIYALSY
ncbi:hypothetical protein EPN52_03060 [bacterium]|nr:MAG: hypothetical protein EPN52_03060 [bacterium]